MAAKPDYTTSTLNSTSLHYYSPIHPGPTRHLMLALLLRLLLLLSAAPLPSKTLPNLPCPYMVPLSPPNSRTQSHHPFLIILGTIPTPPPLLTPTPFTSTTIPLYQQLRPKKKMKEEEKHGMKESSNYACIPNCNSSPHKGYLRTSTIQPLPQIGRAHV